MIDGGQLPVMDPVRTGQRIRKKIKEKGLTEHELAAVLSVSYNTMRSYLSGRRRLSIESLRALADVFDIENIEDLIVWEECIDEER